MKGKKRRRDFSHKVKTIDEDSQSETEKIRKEGAAMGRFRNRFLKKIQADVRKETYKLSDSRNTK